MVPPSHDHRSSETCCKIKQPSSILDGHCRTVGAMKGKCKLKIFVLLQASAPNTGCREFELAESKAQLQGPRDQRFSPKTTRTQNSRKMIKTPCADQKNPPLSTRPGSANPAPIFLQSYRICNSPASNRGASQNYLSLAPTDGPAPLKSQPRTKQTRTQAAEISACRNLQFPAQGTSTLAERHLPSRTPPRSCLEAKLPNLTPSSSAPKSELQQHLT